LYAVKDAVKSSQVLELSSGKKASVADGNDKRQKGPEFTGGHI